MNLIKKIRSKLEGHSFLKNILVLVSGNVLGYAVNLISLPFISRIYLPEQLGEYDLILSSGRFVLDAICLGLLIAIMLPKEDDDAKDLCQLILTLNIFFVSTLFIIFISIRGVYTLFKTSIDYPVALLLLGLYLVSYNIQNLFYSYTNRKKEYKVLFWNPLVLAVTNVGFSVVLGLAGLGTTGYLIGTILSYVVCTVHMGLHVFPFSIKPSVKRWVALLGRYKEIVLVQLPANIVSQAGNEIPTQFLGRAFGSAMLGGYSMAVKILNIPVAVLSVPVNRVVYQTMAEKASKKENIGDFVFGILNKNIKVALIPVGLLTIVGEKLVPLVLGDSWTEAGAYIPILGIMYLLKYCSACVSGTFVAVGKQKLSLIMSFVNLIKFGVCFGLSYALSLNIFYTIISYAVVESLYQLLNLVLCVYCTQYSMRKFMQFTAKYILGGNLLIYLIYFCVKYFIY